MNDRDKTLLIYLGAAIILACAYFFGARPLMEKMEILATEADAMKEEIRLRQEALENSKNYQEKIDELKKEYDEILAKYPADVIDERSLLFLSNIEDFMPGSWFNQVKFAEKDEKMVEGEEAEPTPTPVPEEVTAEDAATEEAGEGANAGTAPAPEVAQGSITQTSLEGLYGIDCELGIEYSMPYTVFKQFLDYLNKYPEKLVIKEINAEISDSDPTNIGGTIKLSQYAISGQDRTIGTPECEEVFLGTSNVFYSGLVAESLPEGSEAANAMGSDVFVKLNGITDNTPNGITVGSSTDTTNETYLSSTKNSKQKVTINITGKAGKYTAKYTIGKSSQSFEFEKNDGDISIRVMCDARMEDDDVAADLYIQNESDKTVNVAVMNDNEDDPRVTFKEKTGDVEVSQ